MRRELLQEVKEVYYEVVDRETALVLPAAEVRNEADALIDRCELFVHAGLLEGLLQVVGVDHVFGGVRPAYYPGLRGRVQIAVGHEF